MNTSINAARRWSSVALRLLLILLLCCIAIDADAQRKRKRTRSKKGNTTITQPKDIGNPFDEAQATALIQATALVQDFSHSDDDLKAVKNYYDGLNKAGKEQMLTHLQERTSAQLNADDKPAALNTINIYHALADKSDEKLPTMLFIKGTIYAEKMDSINLKRTINELQACESPLASEYFPKLNENLSKVINYQPPLARIDGAIWVAEAEQWIGDLDLDTKVKLRTNFIWTNGSGESTSFDMKYGKMNCVDVRPIGADSIYVMWCSEKLNKNNPEFASIFRDITSSASAEIHAEYAQHNKHSSWAKLGVDIASWAGEVLINSILDGLFMPSKKMHLLEAHLKFENDYVMTGTLKYQYWKVDAEGKTDEYKVASSRVMLLRWLSESNIVFEDTNGKLIVHHPYYENENNLKKQIHEYERKSIYHSDFKKNFKKQSLVGHNSNVVWNHEMFKWLALYNDSLMTSNGISSHLQDKNILYNSGMGWGVSKDSGLGLTIEDIPDDIRKKQKLSSDIGIYVGEFSVADLSAAHLSGVTHKDIILAINGIDISSKDAYYQTISKSQPGDWLYFKILRNKKEIIIPIRRTWNLLWFDWLPYSFYGHKLTHTGITEVDDVIDKTLYIKSRVHDNMSEEESIAIVILISDLIHQSIVAKYQTVVAPFGAKYKNVDKQIQNKLHLTTPQGIYITSVDDFSGAKGIYAEGLRRGDVIIDVNNHPISNVSDFERIERSLNIADRMLCKVIRGNQLIDVTIWVTWKNM